jgi:mRNA interferase MazF
LFGSFSRRLKILEKLLRGRSFGTRSGLQGTREPRARTSVRLETDMKPNTEEPLSGHSVRISRGDVFWIAADESRDVGYSHPHVVVQEDLFNQSRIATVVVCALTSNLQRATEPGNVLLEDGEGNLPKRSVVVVSQITSVEKAQLGERIGALSDERVQQILAGLRFQQVSFFER